MKDKKHQLQSLAEQPEVKAFFNQQVHALAPYLYAGGTCGINLTLPYGSEDKVVEIFYDINGAVIRAVGRGDNVYTATVIAKQNFLNKLDKIYNLMDESESEVSFQNFIH